MLELFARAKINLHLHVTGKREDGYHYLDSLIAFTDAGDYLTFEASDTFRLNIAGPFAATLRDTDNSVIKAARLMAQHLGREPEVHITLEKNLPLGAGIGGGSADAATCLTGLNQFWQAGLDNKILESLAAQIGADVPVCVANKAAVIRNLGDIIVPAPALPEIYALLIWPNCFASTPEVYKNLKLESFSDNFNFRKSYSDVTELVIDLKETRNDLQSVSTRLFPAINEALDMLGKTPDCLFSRMSGSGSTVFGIFESAALTKNAAENISAAYPDWWIKPVLIS